MQTIFITCVMFKCLYEVFFFFFFFTQVKYRVQIQSPNRAPEYKLHLSFLYNSSPPASVIGPSLSVSLPCMFLSLLASLFNFLLGHLFYAI